MVRQLLVLISLALAAFGFAATTECQVTVHFRKDQSILTTDAIAELDRFLLALEINGDYTFKVQGHTDSDGSIAYNDALSLARAETVKQYLAEHGVDITLVSVGTFGELDPLATNRNADGMARNRRVLITFTRHAYADTEELRRALMEGSVQHFSIDPTVDQVVQGTAGIQLQFRAGSFVDAQGREVNGPVDVELTEALGSQAMVAHQLSTRSGNRMLETGGMLKVQATTADGGSVRLKASTPMKVALPATQQEEGMELFLSDDGADWTTTAVPLTVTKVQTWVEPRYPVRPNIPFRWPTYVEDQKGRPVKPVEPVMPKEPTAPREESYTRARPWWAFLAPARVKTQNELRYQSALTRHEVQLRKHEKKVNAFKAECASFPDRLERYTLRKIEWDALKELEYEEWYTSTYEPAFERYATATAPIWARYDSLLANWENVRTASLREYVLRSDSMNTADMGGLNAYVFTTSELGWINCDRFYDVPEEQKREVIARTEKQTDAQIFLVFDRINSLMGMSRRKAGHYTSPPVARNESATLFAYAVIDGRAHVSMSPLSPNADEKLEFRPSSFAEIGQLLKDLGSSPS